MSSYNDGYFDLEANENEFRKRVNGAPFPDYGKLTRWILLRI